LHARAKPVRSGTLQITGLKCTFHGKRLGNGLVDFNKARQCTGCAAPRQYLFDVKRHFLGADPSIVAPSVNSAQNIAFFVSALFASAVDKYNITPLSIAFGNCLKTGGAIENS